MKVLWVCNIMLPAIAGALHKEASNKEGWLSGLLEQVAAENADSNATGKRRPGAFTDKYRC